MLYEHWQSIATERANQVAVFDPHGDRDWTFGELAQLVAETGELEEPVQFVTGNDVQFFIEILRGWRDSVPVFPLERGQARPGVPQLDEGIVHLKQTSGTTGEPRLIAFTAEQLAADASNIIATMGLDAKTPNLAAISLAHSYGFSNVVTPLLLHGIPVILSPTPLPEMLKQAAEGHKRIALPAVPAMWRAWHAAGAIPGNTRVAISAGAPLPLELEHSVFDQLGLKIHNFCGSSECGGIAYDRSESPRDDASMIGDALENVSLSTNAEGCLVVESSSVGTSYIPSDPLRLSNGRFTTSDLAELNHQTLRITGRQSDLINVAGRKLSPETVENAVQQIKGVTNCVAFGVASKDNARCDEVAIALQLDASATTNAIKQHIAMRLPAWQRPRHWWLVDQIEVNSRGKVSRSEWRERFLSRHAQERQLNH